MRKCLRCDEVMIEDYGLRTENLTPITSVVLSKGDGFFSAKNMGKIKATVCPKCGEISIFFDELYKIK